LFTAGTRRLNDRDATVTAVAARRAFNAAPEYHVGAAVQWRSVELLRRFRDTIHPCLHFGGHFIDLRGEEWRPSGQRSGNIPVSLENQCSAVAEVGNRLATIDVGRKLGVVPLFGGGGELGPHLTQCKGDPCNMDHRVIWTTSITTHQLLACYTTVFCDNVMLVS